MSNSNDYRDVEGPHVLFRVRFLGVHVELFAGLSLPLAKGLLPFLRRVFGLPELPLKPISLGNGIVDQVEVRPSLSPEVQSPGNDPTKPL